MEEILLFNTIYSYSLVVMLFFSFIEISLIIFGFSFLSLDFDFLDGLNSKKNYANIEIPIFIYIVLFLLIFSLIGLGIHKIFDFSAYYSFVPVFLITLIIQNFLIIKIFSKYFKNKETTSFEDFANLEVIVVMGVASTEKTANAKVIDKNGNSHYIMIEMIKGELKEGEIGIIVKVEKNNDTFKFLVEKKDEIKMNFKNEVFEENVKKIEEMKENV